MKGFIEVTTLATVTSFDQGFEVDRTVHEVELINLNNIAYVSNTGNIVLMRGYPNGDHVCRTNHTYEEIKELIKQATEVKP